MSGTTIDRIERNAALEEAARVCDQMQMVDDPLPYDPRNGMSRQYKQRIATPQECAAAIRRLIDGAKDA